MNIWRMEGYIFRFTPSDERKTTAKSLRRLSYWRHQARKQFRRMVRREKNLGGYL